METNHSLTETLKRSQNIQTLFNRLFFWRPQYDADEADDLEYNRALIQRRSEVI